MVSNVFCDLSMLATLYEAGVKSLLSCLVRSGFHVKMDARCRELEPQKCLVYYVKEMYLLGR